METIDKSTLQQASQGLLSGVVAGVARDGARAAGEARAAGGRGRAHARRAARPRHRGRARAPARPLHP
ncbi:Protein of unknown function, partial [Gryllus bimaculatus]